MPNTPRTLIALLLMSAAQTAMAQPFPESTFTADQQTARQQELAERLRAVLAELEQQGFSGFAAVTGFDQTPILVNAGAADPSDGRPYDLHTQFDVGSITKPLAGLGAAMLMANGTLDADATLSDFFDNVPADKADITLHQLLTHSAGFADAHGFDRKPLSREQMLTAAFDQELRFAPGEGYAYSNTGFSIVAAIIEDVTGKEFEVYMVEDVLRPLGLNSTGYHRALDVSRADASAEYGPVPEASWGDLNPVSWALTGNGGMVSSAHDLLRLGQLIAEGDLPPEVAELWTTPRVSEGGGSEYGFGIGTMHIDGIGTILWHNGGNPAFQTEWWTILETRQTLLVHRNGGPPIEEALSAALAATTGVELSFGNPDADVEMRSGALPTGTPEADLVSAFLVALDSEASWRTFVETRMAAALLEQMPIEEHLAFFPTLKTDLQSRQIAAHAITEYRILVDLAAANGTTVRLLLMPITEGGILKLVGIGVN